MSKEHTGTGGDPPDDDTTDMSALITTIEAAIDEHQRSQRQLRETISELETSIEEHTKSEQKLREVLTHAEYLIDEFETELSKDYRTQERAQGGSHTEEQPTTVTHDGSSGDSNAIDGPATGDSRRDSMLEALAALSADLDRLPDESDIRQQTDFTPQDYAGEFGSYMSACRESNIDLERYVLADIEAVAEQRENIPPMSGYQNEGRFPQSIIKSLFGSWKDTKKELYRQRSLSGFTTTTTSFREELAHQLRELEETLGHLPSAEDINDNTWVRHEDYLGEFGSIEAAFEECGFDVEQRILQDIKQVEAKTGTIPSLSHYKQHGKCSINIVTNYFDSWSATKEKYMQQRGEIDSTEKNTQIQENSQDADASDQSNSGSDILDTIVNDIGETATQSENRSQEIDNGDESAAESQPENAQKATDDDRISDKYDDRIVEAVNAHFESKEEPMSHQLRERRQNAAAALRTAINTTDALGRREIEHHYYDEELYTSRGSFWKQDIRPVLQEFGHYDRTEGGYVFPEISPD